MKIFITFHCRKVSVWTVNNQTHFHSHDNQTDTGYLPGLPVFFGERLHTILCSGRYGVPQVLHLIANTQKRSTKKQKQPWWIENHHGSFQKTQIKNRIYGHDVKFHAVAMMYFVFHKNNQKYFLFCIFVRLKQFLNVRFGVGLRPKTFHFHRSS